MKIAYNLFLPSRRSSKRYHEVLDGLSRQPQAAGNSASTPPDEVDDLWKYLSILSEQDRAVLILSYAHGFSHSEISQALKLPAGSVKSLIHRAKLRIREHFKLTNPVE